MPKSIKKMKGHHFDKVQYHVQCLKSYFASLPGKSSMSRTSFTSDLKEYAAVALRSSTPIEPGMANMKPVEAKDIDYYMSRICGIASEADAECKMVDVDPMLSLVSSILLNKAKAMDGYIDRQEKCGNHSIFLQCHSHILNGGESKKMS